KGNLCFMSDAQLFIYADKYELKWLNVCLRSAQKYWKSAYPPLIVTTPQCKDILPSIVRDLRCTIIFKRPLATRPQSRALARFTASSYVSASRILFFEPDALFTRPCCSDDFHFEGKPAILIEDLKEVMRISAPEVRNAIEICASIIEEILGKELEYSY